MIDGHADEQMDKGHKECSRHRNDYEHAIIKEWREHSLCPLSIVRKEAESMQFRGVAHRYGRDVDTDVIIPARYLVTSDPTELAKHCLEDLDVSFVQRVQPGDILVAEENFGCGSSREHAPLALKAAGIEVVIAKSFARIFYRNAINTGLAIMECSEAVDAIEQGNVVSVNAETGTICNESTGIQYHAQPFPPFIQEIIKAGGLIERTKAKRGVQ